MTGNISTDLLQALMAATDEQRAAALKLLRGEGQDHNPLSEPFLTLKEVAAQLRLHPSTLWRWDVPRHDLAGRPRFLLSEVRAYLETDEFKRKAADLRAERKDKRKEQLLALAAEGNEEAAADLFKEFGVEVKPGGREGGAP